MIGRVIGRVYVGSFFVMRDCEGHWEGLRLEFLCNERLGRSLGGSTLGVSL